MRAGGGGGPAAPYDRSAPRLGRRELRILAPFLRPHAPRAAAAVLLMIAAQAGQLVSPLLLRTGIDEGIRGGRTSALDRAALGMAVAAVVVFVCTRVSITLSGRVGERALQQVRVRAFDHLTSLDLAFFEREKTGRLVARLTSDVETIQLLVNESLVQMVSTTLYLIGSVVVLFVVDVTLAVASLAFVLPLTLMTVLRFRRRSEQTYLLVRDRIAAVLSFMQETVRGVAVVQAFGRERINADRFAEVNEEWRDANNESFRIGSRFFPVMELIGLAGTMIVLVYGGWRTMNGTLSLGELAAFVLYLSSTLEPVQQLSQLYDTFQSAMSGLAKLAGILDERPTIVDAPTAVGLDRPAGEVALDDVTFRYRPELPAALADVRIDLPAGSTLALVGPTGAGKSTIAKLLLRFYDPTSGAVRYDGRDLRLVTLASLRATASVVPQEGFLFSGSVRDNVRFGRPDATDDEVRAVCRLLEIDRVVEGLPDGYETEVRERGAALSGGERQLIAIARAMLADPRVLVLDEATSALDSATEAHVESALRLASAGRTTVVIAHRLSTAARADQIAVVDGGRIVESGSHTELLERGGLYAKLFEHWLASGARQN